MLLRKSVIVLVLSVLVVAMAAASVSAASAISNNGPSLNNLKSGTGGYVVTFGNNPSVSAQSLTVQAMSLQNVITQGKYQWAQKTISGNPTTIYTDVNWGNAANSISLTVYTPDGYVLGPYYDNIDGMINGDIPLAITRPGGVSSGTYYYQMYGYKISGSQPYTFS